MSSHELSNTNRPAGGDEERLAGNRGPRRDGGAVLDAPSLAPVRHLRGEREKEREREREIKKKEEKEIEVKTSLSIKGGKTFFVAPAS